MQQYYGVKKEDSILHLNKDDFNHIKNVMRMKENDKIIVAYMDKSYICSLNKDLLSCKIERVFKDNEDNTSYVAYIPLLSEEKMNFILQHGTELGVTEFIVVMFKHCKYKLNNKDFEKKLIRWNRIAKEASEQSYRVHKAIVSDIIKVDKIKSNSNVNILCSLVKENVNKITSVLTVSNSNDTISIVFGPEGGLDKDEEGYLESVGFIRTSLLDKVLRSETVILYVSSVRSYLKEVDINGKF